MPSYETKDIRNIALLGHGGVGKTSLAEALLKEAGVIGQVGLVEKGTTVSDFHDEEKEHGHSLALSVVHADFKGKHINLIDTPGYPDFVGAAFSALPAVETAAIVISAQAGIESNTRRLMQKAKDRNLCRVIIINKIDAENIDLPALVDQIQEMFGRECIPVNLPADGCKKVIDVLRKAEGETDFGDVETAHTAIVDQVVEVDEALMAKYLEQGEVTLEELHAPFEKALRDGHLVPILFCSARHHANHEETVGIHAMMDFIIDLAPNPTEGNPRPFVKSNGDGSEEEFFAKPDASMPAMAHTFNVTIDPFVGKLSIFRIHQGRVAKDTNLIVGDARKGFRVGHLFKLQGKEHKEVDEGIPGDICALAKVDEIHFGSVLHEGHDTDHVHLRPIAFPQPMFGKAITAKSRGDEAKIGDALHKLIEEDPCLKVERNAVTKETVIRGMGELHLRIALEKMKNRDKAEVDAAPPKIAYKETVTGYGEGHHRHKKQTGGAGQFGEVYCKVEASEPGTGLEFVDELVGESIPRSFLPAIRKGIEQAYNSGALAGYPMQDVRVRVYDGKHHPVDSKEVAFVSAGKKAFLDGFNKAKPVLLEPIVDMEVTVPTASMGDINSDLSGKRGRVQGTDMLPGDMVVIKVKAPLAEVANYQSQLKSVTGGQGTFAMEFSHYEPIPGNVQQQIIGQYKPRAEED